MSDPQNLPQTTLDWLRYAEGDLRVAEGNLESESPSFHTICFLCQGSAEKFLKAYLISKGWELEKTHDVLKLLDYCLAYDSSFKELVSSGEIVNEYIVAGRYPGILKQSDLTKEDAEEATQATRKIREYVAKLIAKDKD